MSVEKCPRGISLLCRSLGKQVSPPGRTGVEQSYAEEWHLLAFLSVGFFLVSLAVIVENAFKWAGARCQWG